MFDEKLVPLYESILWIVFWSSLLFIFRKNLFEIVNLLKRRIGEGAAFTFGSISIGEPPRKLTDGGPDAVAVSDKDGIKSLPSEKIQSEIDNAYKKLVDNYFVLHNAEVTVKRTVPGSGRYKVKIWIESWNDKSLDGIESVTYRIYGDFNQPTISTKSNKTGFDLWLSVYGEFPVLVLITKKDGSLEWLSKYIDLPGRPPD
ncbi:MAG: hypothetical protein IPM56_03100 [Ignavibacteriales bacterium]|nr:MAG: hypothetical protein IPM56_03100 [Ignavibacteriales bacterium]